ncbi:hypothetical protein A5802_000109 [Enterococcus mundtii]|uniref:Gram-positive cocci surface proteins LPxTG domain-containing protein n=2 Tax=Enterococcus mundtii TaxID=53346 RepID=A0A242KX99_ENTMU|nr:hypothetical protein A5802_000109 [Enterococcus mundtii]
MTNKLTPGSVTLTKTDEDTGETLPGAVKQKDKLPKTGEQKPIIFTISGILILIFVLSMYKKFSKKQK